MDATTYRISDQAIWRGTIRLVCSLISVAFVLGALNIYRDGWSKAIGEFIVTLVVMTVISTLVVRKRRETFNGMTCSISDTTLTRTSGGGSFSDEWQNITSVIAVTNRAGQIAQLILRQKSRPVSLAGYENMDDLANQILKRVPATATIHRIPWYEPWINALAIYGGGALFIAGLARYGAAGLTQHLDQLIPFSGGLLFLLAKPISQTKPGSRPMEIGLGIILLVSPLVMIAVGR